MSTTPGPQGPAGVVSAAGPGTALLPSISFAADPNTGLYNLAADQIGFSTGGVLRWTMDTAGGLLGSGPLYVDTPVSSNKLVYFRSAGSTRWHVNAGFQAEAGSNTGANLQISAYNDAGAQAVNPFVIQRVDGRVDIPLLNPTVLAPTGNVIEQRNGTNAQRYILYNTYTDAGNYERLSLTAGGTSFNIATERAGTGVARILAISGASHVYVRPGGLANNWLFHSSGTLYAETDNLYDIGGSGALRPRTIYAGTSVVTPALVVSAAPAFVAGDRYLVVDASGNVHKSAIGPAS